MHSRMRDSSLKDVCIGLVEERPWRGKTYKSLIGGRIVMNRRVLRTVTNEDFSCNSSKVPIYKQQQIAISTIQQSTDYQKTEIFILVSYKSRPFASFETKRIDQQPEVNVVNGINESTCNGPTFQLRGSLSESLMSLQAVSYPDTLPKPQLSFNDGHGAKAGLSISIKPQLYTTNRDTGTSIDSYYAIIRINTTFLKQPKTSSSASIF